MKSVLGDTKRYTKTDTYTRINFDAYIKWMFVVLNCRSGLNDGEFQLIIFDPLYLLMQNRI